MIAYLQGKIELWNDKFVILNVGNVGYKIFLPQRALYKLTQGQENVKIFIHTHLTEGAINLYGFIDYDDLKIFELLVSEVSGIGPKSALGILNAGDAKTIMTAVAKNNEQILESVAGIGKKTAQKILFELKDKLKKVEGIEMIEGVESKMDAENALVALGYSRGDARDVLKDLKEEKVEDLVKAALKKLGK